MVFSGWFLNTFKITFTQKILRMDSHNCLIFLSYCTRSHSTLNCTYLWGSPCFNHDQAFKWSSSHYHKGSCHNSSLGLATKAKGLQGCKPRENPGVISHTPGNVRKCEGVNLHTPKATPTLGDGVSMDFQNFREQFQGSKLHFLWRSLFHWKALGT